MKRIVGVILLLAASMLTGCASTVPMARFDQDAKAKQFTPDRDKAALYIYRNESSGPGIPLDVSVNGQKIGASVVQSYFLINLAPGSYTIEVSAKNAEGLSKSNDSTLTLSLEAGKNYFVWQDVGSGIFFAHNTLQQVDEDTGRAGVMASARIADTSNSVEPSSAQGAKSSGNGVAAANSDIVFGASAVTVEKLAIKRNCQPVSGATLFFKNGPIEDYRVKCSDGSELGAHCEYRQCLLN